MAKKKNYINRNVWEVYDVLTGKTAERTETELYNNLTKEDAKQWLAQIVLWCWEDCLCPEMEVILEKYGSHYDIRKMGRGGRGVSSKERKAWEEFYRLEKEKLAAWTEDLL